MKDVFNYKRRPSSTVHIGNIPLGGNNPIQIQSMTNTNTNDIDESVEQSIRIIEAGAAYVRLTAQGIREANSLELIKNKIRERGYKTPLIADIHFNPHVAEVAAEIVEKVRINPGNYVDKVKTFTEQNLSEDEYQQEIGRLRDKLMPLIDICKRNNTVIRVGVNHGSLSDRIMNRYGNTPEGMVESCMEVLRIFSAENFNNIVISMKASNTVLMTQAVRLLVEAMDKEDFHFPLHLGVTEAGKGEDGRIKSAVGIGALLSDGLGDTIRVSLSEDPEYEVPVAKILVDYIQERNNHIHINGSINKDYESLSFEKRRTKSIENIGGEHTPIVISNRSNGDFHIDSSFQPDYIYTGKNIPSDINYNETKFICDFEIWNENIPNTYPLFNIQSLKYLSTCQGKIKFVELFYTELTEAVISILKDIKNVVLIIKTNHINGVGEQRAFIHSLISHHCDIPVIIYRAYNETSEEKLQVKAAADIGTILLDGFGNGIMIENKNKSISHTTIDKYMFGILQAARLRNSKTEYISCPGCGRTLFDLQTTVDKVQKETSHLKHLKIAVMGCIVNGVGEMADADYGYVGASKGKISLYKKKELIERNIPSDEAVKKLIELIKHNNDWVEP